MSETARRSDDPQPPPGNETSCCQVQTTVANEAAARQIAATLVGERLAACVQILGPLTSTYRWQGEVERSQEWLCIVKCRAADYVSVEAAIRRLHDYDTPEILATPIVAGSRAYLDWLMRETERRD